MEIQYKFAVVFGFRFHILEIHMNVFTVVPVLSVVFCNIRMLYIVGHALDLDGHHWITVLKANKRIGEMEWLSECVCENLLPKKLNLE
jgi:hypothetical protein